MLFYILNHIKMLSYKAVLKLDPGIQSFVTFYEIEMCVKHQKNMQSKICNQIK